MTVPSGTKSTMRVANSNYLILYNITLTYENNNTLLFYHIYTNKTL